MAQNQAYDRIRANLDRVEMRILRACARAQRDRDEVTLVAVTKTRTLGEVIAAHGSSLRHFGENRVEDLEAKLPHLRQSLGQDLPLWHMIGHTQSRKAARVVAAADLIHSVDSMRLARRLDRFAQEAERVVPVLLQCNVSGEEAKYGFDAATPLAIDALEAELADLESLTHLDVRGIMTMAPIVTDPEDARPVFVRLREVRDRLRDALPFSDWQDLSMGMTDDFEVAIEEGATLVRIGRAIFGPRNE